MPRYSVEICNDNPLSLMECLKRCDCNIPDFDSWSITINAGGINYGVYMNFDCEEMALEISNCPFYGSDGDDCLDDVFECFEDEDDEEADD